MVADMDQDWIKGAIISTVVVANISIIPWATTSPRLTDVLSLGGWLLVIYWHTHDKIRQKYLYRGLIIAAFPSIWLFVSAYVNDTRTLFASIRWVAAIPWGIVLYKMTIDDRSRAGVMHGLIIGSLINVSVLSLQAQGYTPLLMDFGFVPLDADRRFVSGHIRYSGIFGLSNSTMPVITTAVLGGLYFYFVEDRSVLYLLGTYSILAIGTLLTLTRAPAAVSMVLFASVFITAIELNGKYQIILKKRTLENLLVGLVCVMGYLLFVGPPGGLSRWTTNVVPNLLERVDSTLEGAVYSLYHPLGTGEKQLLQTIGPTHNGFLQLSGTFGLLFALLISVLMMISAISVYTRDSKSQLAVGIVGQMLIGLLMFEMLFNNPTIIILSTYVTFAGFDILSSIIHSSQFSSKSMKRSGISGREDTR